MCKEGGGWEGDWVFYMIERGWAILDGTNFETLWEAILVLF